MERRQNNGERCKIVQDFLQTVEDATERLVCFMFLHNYRDGEVCKQLKITRKRLQEIKDAIERKLVTAGIKTAEG